MVMRNRHEEPSWWDELPPGLRARFAAPPLDNAETGEHVPLPAPEPSGRSSSTWILDLSRLAVLFLAVAIANVLFLILALAFVDGQAALLPLKGR